MYANQDSVPSASYFVNTMNMVNGNGGQSYNMVYENHNNMQMFQQGPFMANQFTNAYEPVRGDISLGNSHQAHVSIINTHSDYNTAVMKRKRKRTKFTTEQIEALESIFRGKQYITNEERQLLGAQLQISDKPLKVWFQNRRQKEKKKCCFDLEREKERENVTSSTNQLEYVNSQNNFEYVTQDNRAMNDFVQAVDNVIPNDLNLPQPTNGLQAVVDYGNRYEIGPIYEPISPANPLEDTIIEELFS